MRILISLASLTGNTRKIALYIEEKLKQEGHQVTFNDSRKMHTPEPQDLSILFFWCRRGSMDDDSLAVLEHFQNQKVAAIGTIGGDVSSPYGLRVHNNVKAVLEEHNSCVGVVICQGKLSKAKIESRRNLPESNSKHLTDEKYQMYLSNQCRPDERDFQAAWEAMQSWISYLLL